MTTCFCGNPLAYSDCCQPYHEGVAFAPTAEKLMRSRYSAYALKNTDYLLATWSKNTRPATFDLSQETTNWQKLDILKIKKGGERDEKGRVEFNAHYVQEGKFQTLHEVSRFKKVAGRWFYVDGQWN